MNEPRVYKNSPFVFGLMLVLFAVMLVAFVFAAGDLDLSNLLLMLFFALMFVFLFVFLVFTATAQTIISNDEIATKNLLGKKSFAWNEIDHVSGSGYRIKLHNAGNMSIAPSPQLPGYAEVIEQIGIKRPDLFNPQEFSEMSRGLAGTIITSLFWFLILMGLGLYILITQASDIFVPFLVFVGFGLIAVGMQVTSPYNVAIQGSSIVIGYLLNKKTLPANEIASINLVFTQTRYGKNYFVAIYLVNKKTIRISGLKPGLPVSYLVLKNWHNKNTQNRQVTQ